MLKIIIRRTCTKHLKNARLALSALLGLMMSMAIQAAPPSAPGGLCITNSSGQVTCPQGNSVSATGGGNGATSTGIIAPSRIADPRNNFHPGYYMLVGARDGVETFNIIKNNPDFLGVKKIYAWTDIEKAEGVYDFSQIEQDLAYLQSIGKRLWINPEYTQWGSSSPPRVPSYMWKDPKYGGQAPYYGAYQNPVGTGAWRPVIWNTYVQSRLVAFYTALGKRFNNEPYIEGITLGETSMPVGPGYTAGGVENAFKSIALATKNAFPNKVIFSYPNWGPPDPVLFSQWLAANGIGLGEPDVVINPSNPEVYALEKTYHNVIPTGPDVQWDNYERCCNASGINFTSAEILDWTVNTTNPWYMMWEHREPYFTKDVIPAIHNYGPLPAARDFYNTLK